VAIWNWRKDSRLRTLDACGPISPVAFSPDGKLLATGGAGNEVKLWTPQAGKPRAALEGHRSAIASLAFSPDGTLLASGGTDHVVQLWRMENAQEK
jgi:WD40 repeat protein